MCALNFQTSLFTLSKIGFVKVTLIWIQKCFESDIDLPMAA